MRVLHYTQPHHLPTLSDELISGVPSVAPILVDGVLTAVMTVDGSGDEITLTVPDDADEPAIAAVVASHDPTPPPRVIDYAGSVAVDAVVRTTNATLTEVFRLTTAPRQLARGTFSMMAVDAVSGDSKDMEVRLNFRQQSGAAVQVGATRPLYDPIETPAAAAWAIQGAADGADFLVGVRGAAGRTIDWVLTGAIRIYAPEGL